MSILYLDNSDRRSTIAGLAAEVIGRKTGRSKPDAMTREFKVIADYP